MKKLILAVSAVLFIASASFASGWGVGVKLGAGENDAKSLKDFHNAFGGTLDEGYALFGVEGQYEWALNETGKLGFRFGLEGYGDNELKVGPSKITETTYAIPLTVYYRMDRGIKTVSWYAGAGLSYIYTEVECKNIPMVGDEHKSKFFPHVLVGAEYRFTKLFALGVEAKYNISAEVKKDGYKTDRSGFSGALVGRFYF